MIVQAFQNTQTFNPDIANYESFFSDVEQCSFNTAKKEIFSPFLDTKLFFATKIANHYDQQLTPSESWDEDIFLSLGLGYLILKSG